MNLILRVTYFMQQIFEKLEAGKAKPNTENKDHTYYIHDQEVYASHLKGRVEWFHNCR